MQAVGQYMKKNLNTLERIQSERRASKIVKGMKHLSYEERLKRLKLIKIKDRTKRGDLIETYKIMTRKLKVDPNQFFKKDLATRTRGNHLKLLKPRSNIRSKFFSRRVVDCWNRLPDEVVSAETTNTFKAKLDKYYQNYQSKQDEAISSANA